MRLPACFTSCSRVNCCNWVPALVNCSGKTSFTERFGLYWRDTVMLAGLVTSIIGAVVSFFSAAILFGIFFSGTALVIGFGGYYVSRYAELKELKEQLKNLQKANTQLTAEVNRFQGLNGALEASVADLNLSLAARGEELAETSRQFESFRNTNVELARTNNQLQSLTALLRSLTQDAQEAEMRAHAANARSAGIQASIEVETRHLQAIRGQIASEVGRLQSATSLLEQHVAALPSLRAPLDALKHLTESSSVANIDRVAR